MYSEEELLPLSGLSHMAFCARRWALIHIECVWEDNRFTTEGTLLHEKAHSGDIESRPGVLIRRTLPVRSFRLGLSGQADIVEFQPMPSALTEGIVLPGRRGSWKPFPVEYKRSRDKLGSRAYRMQLCAQALCLEEMLGIPIAEGAIFDGTTRRRQDISFNSVLRAEVEQLASEMHRLYAARETPPPIPLKACPSCSLIEICCPEPLSHGTAASRYLEQQKRACL
jgi:CRISPR-associated exonuclease Cas4